MSCDSCHLGEGRPAVRSVALEMSLTVFSIPWACWSPPANWVRAFSGTDVTSWFGYPPRMSSAASLLKVKKEVC